MTLAMVIWTLELMDKRGAKDSIFFKFCRGEGVSEGRGRPDFFELTILDFLSCSLPTL